MVEKKDALVKVDSILYEKVRKKVEKDKIEFPSIKNFFEKAVKQLLEFDEEIKKSIKDQHKENKNKKVTDHEANNYNLRVPSGVG